MWKYSTAETCEVRQWPSHIADLVNKKELDVSEMMRGMTWCFPGDQAKARGCAKEATNTKNPDLGELVSTQWLYELCVSSAISVAQQRRQLC